ncbi:hypothetical protein P154DRAFT_532959 [Amniculicola lignicola CBS 123094]|uniref:Uncharacterized protein n=1 Tax=Amniculicola lignicola CBS 123094 TaxID=1392246 RepID=A0A6A5WLD3_9PLEO|nr:hypothetical protein P154DRAFT_532959 [Amniculicola lignicola CBS 123094]
MFDEEINPTPKSNTSSTKPGNVEYFPLQDGTAAIFKTSIVRRRHSLANLEVERLEEDHQDDEAVMDKMVVPLRDESRAVFLVRKLRRRHSFFDFEIEEFPSDLSHPNRTSSDSGTKSLNPSPSQRSQGLGRRLLRTCLRGLTMPVRAFAKVPAVRRRLQFAFSKLKDRVKIHFAPLLKAIKGQVSDISGQGPEPGPASMGSRSSRLMDGSLAQSTTTPEGIWSKDGILYTVLHSFNFGARCPSYAYTLRKEVVPAFGAQTLYGLVQAIVKMVLQVLHSLYPLIGHHFVYSASQLYIMAWAFDDWREIRRLRKTNPRRVTLEMQHISALEQWGSFNDTYAIVQEDFQRCFPGAVETVYGIMTSTTTERQAAGSAQDDTGIANTQLQIVSQGESSNHGQQNGKPGSSSQPLEKMSLSELSSLLENSYSLTNKRLITTVSAFVATVHAMHGIYATMAGREKRRRWVKDGEMSPEEARRRKAKNALQDTTGIGVAALSIRSAIKMWRSVDGDDSQSWLESRLRHNYARNNAEDIQKRWTMADSGVANLPPDLATASTWENGFERRWHRLEMSGALLGRFSRNSLLACQNSEDAPVYVVSDPYEAFLLSLPVPRKYKRHKRSSFFAGIAGRSL